MHSVAAALRPTLGLVRLNTTRCLSCSARLSKSNFDEKGFMGDDALAVREARKKKKDEAANKKMDPELLLSRKERLAKKSAAVISKEKLENEKRPTYTYKKELLEGYLPDTAGAERRTLLRRDKDIFKLKRQDKTMEVAHRRHYLEIPLSVVHSNYMKEPEALAEVALTAIHYNIAKDVFRQEGLLLTTPLCIRYPNGDFVQRGNLVEPAKAQGQPSFSYTPANDDTLYTAIMTTPDGNIFSYREEVLHWMSCNIPGNKIAKGDEICAYMPPIPCEGTGYHRYAFVLLRQEARIEGLEVLPRRDLEKRSFSTAAFIKEHGAGIRGLAFHQAIWDESVGDVFGELACGEPTYALEQPKRFFLDPEQSQAVFKRRAYLRHKT